MAHITRLPQALVGFESLSQDIRRAFEIQRAKLEPAGGGALQEQLTEESRVDRLAGLAAAEVETLQQLAADFEAHLEAAAPLKGLGGGLSGCAATCFAGADAG